MGRKYKMDDPEGIYFITSTVVEWADVFTREVYKKAVIDSLNYCIDKKGLVVHAYVIMSNHIHLVISQRNCSKPISNIVRDFKKFTAYKIIQLIQGHTEESRRNWLLPIFRQHGKANSKNHRFQFWQQHNHPVLLYSSKFIHQKINYIHNNPVKAGLVEHGAHYCYSSCARYHDEGVTSKVPIVLLDAFYNFGI